MADDLHRICPLWDVQVKDFAGAQAVQIDHFPGFAISLIYLDEDDDWTVHPLMVDEDGNVLSDGGPAHLGIPSWNHALASVRIARAEADAYRHTLETPASEWSNDEAGIALRWHCRSALIYLDRC